MKHYVACDGIIDFAAVSMPKAGRVAMPFGVKYQSDGAVMDIN